MDVISEDNAGASRLGKAILACGVTMLLASYSAPAVAGDGLGGLVTSVGDSLGDNAVGSTVGTVGKVLTSTGDALDGGNGSTSGGLGRTVGNTVGGSTGSALNNTVSSVGDVLNGRDSNTAGGGTGGGNGNGGGFGGNGNGGGFAGNGNGGGFGGNGNGGGDNGLANQGANGGGQRYATTCGPLGDVAYNSFSAVDRSQSPLGQIKGVVLSGNTIVKARFLANPDVFGKRRCVTVSGGPITVAGTRLVLPVSRESVFQQIGN